MTAREDQTTASWMTDNNPDFGSGSGSSYASRRKPVLVYLLIALALGIAVVLMVKATWSDHVIVGADGQYELSPEREAQIEREKDKLDNCFQYRLVAIKKGVYPCKFCPSGTIKLKKGHTWKIGETCSGRRYTKKELAELNVAMIEEVHGDKVTVRKAEIAKIGAYVIMPENLARPEKKRLIVPPGNKTLDLR